MTMPLVFALSSWLISAFIFNFCFFKKRCRWFHNLFIQALFDQFHLYFFVFLFHCVWVFSFLFVLPWPCLFFSFFFLVVITFCVVCFISAFCLYVIFYLRLRRVCRRGEGQEDPAICNMMQAKYRTKTILGKNFEFMSSSCMFIVYSVCVF